MGSTPPPAVAHFRGALAVAQVFKARMTISNRLVTLQVLATLHNSVALNTATNTKAASTYVNCDCQCSSLTFQDKFGRTQGNCKTADNTGATWCYVDSRSPCLDKQRSVRFSQSGHAWSYQACSTPPRHSAQCSAFGSSKLPARGDLQRQWVLSGRGQLSIFVGAVWVRWLRHQWQLWHQWQLPDGQHRQLQARSELQCGKQRQLWVRKLRLFIWLGKFIWL